MNRANDDERALPDGGDGQAFDAPWQAEALAIAVALQDAGLFTAAEWAEALGRERNRAGLAADGSDYYQSVVDALEALLSGKAIATRGEISATARSWRRAARATPHGKPILLENDPQFGAE
ncbi:nitrile hydratase accessory protein [Mesorhizobium xinjiangense]|uniref:nitrile hydratase accessory protein n=1 Tax=Mesorhizobium xinjiangense TaxID=2678685 RepID=UPI001F405259|nr:nitrile hydratase accessory protein [Mesorhizobium xinjiangense]